MDPVGGTGEVGSADPGVEEGASVAPSEQPGAGRGIHERAALAVFGVAWVAAFPVLLHAARRQWFFLDEWSFLAARHLTDLSDLLEPHNEHWSTVPIILYRLTFAVVGLNHYWPYLLLAVSAHLAVAALLRVIMRRAGVDPWSATAGAILFAYLGSGRANFGWGFQVGFSGALAFGLAQLVLADQSSRRLTRRDVLALAFGLAALMSAGVGVFTVGAVGLATLLRRGWRVALFHVGPLAVLYLLWWVVQAPSATGSISAGAEVVIDIVAATGRGIAGGTALAWLMLALLVGGLGAGLARDPGRVRGTWAAPIAMLAFGLVFAVTTGIGRGEFYEAVPVAKVGHGRYVHIMAGFILPAVVLAVSHLATRSRVFVAMGAVLLVSALAANVTSLEPRRAELYTLGRPDRWVALADAAAAHPVPAEQTVAEGSFPYEWVTVGWLRSIHQDGKVPHRSTITETQRGAAELELLLVPVSSVSGDCEPAGEGKIRLERGEVAQVPIPRAWVSWIVDGKPRARSELRGRSIRLAVEATTQALTLEFADREGKPVAVTRCG